MNIWFTSDCHFGHANIIKYCNRPFKTLEDMNYGLIRNWNARVKPDDLVFHIGDFCFKNGPATVDRGEGSFLSANFYENQLNGKVIFINGSHDNNNTCSTPIENMWIKYGGKNILMFHNPADYMDSWIPQPDLILCGHVHEKWKVKVTSAYRIPMINVGVDQWDFRPVSIHELLNVVK